jgi:hypothetical protein
MNYCARVLFRQLFWCKRRFCPNDVRSHVPDIPKETLPWFWVGAQLEDRVECITDIVNNYVQYDTPVNPEFLKEITGCDAKKWVYLDAKTLEEKEFPPEGIVIEYVDRDQSISDSE